MSEFNLIDEPWIPVRFLDGRRAELGIRDTLGRAKDIVAIEDQSPLVVAALHRVLLAVLYRALEGPTDITQARIYFRDGIPADKVINYLSKWHERFWLWDDRAPFWQIPNFTPKELRSWTALAVEHNADNAKVLFDHVSLESAGSVSSSAAARWLVAVQTFAVSSGKSELAHTGGAPSATAVMVLPSGVNLEDTLLLCLVPQNQAVVSSDLPVWERGPESLERLKSGPTRAATGIADLYTWRSRAIGLRADEHSRISTLAFASGIGYAHGALNDPMVAYRIDNKLGRVPVQLRERGLWRDFDSLLPNGAGLAPSVMEHASILTQRDRKRRPRAVTVIGQATNKAKIDFWRSEFFALPDTVAIDGIARAQIHELLKEAEDIQHALWMAAQSFARDVISRGDRQPAAKDVTALVRQMTVIPHYWAMLEIRFHDLLRNFTMQREFETVRMEWLSAIRDSLRGAWQSHASSVSLGDTWAIRALVKAERIVIREFTNLDSQIARLSEEIVA